MAKIPIRGEPVNLDFPQQYRDKEQHGYPYKKLENELNPEPEKRLAQANLAL